MSLFPEPPDSDIDCKHLEDGHYVVYVVKRPACAFILARRGSRLVNFSDHGGCDHVQKRLDGVGPQCRDRHPEEESALASPYMTSL
jgi:hypothetical protein